MTERQRAQFYALIESTGEGCWEWTAGKDTSGYGRLSIGSKETLRTVGAHRLAWMLAYPDVDLSSSDFICHHCDNPPCCRVDHLFLGTAADNMRDKVKKGRAWTPWGEKHPWARLTEPDVLAIRASKDTRRILAARFRISMDHVKHIKLRRRWKNLEEDDLEALFGDN